jgi:PKD repeat protein
VVNPAPVAPVAQFEADPTTGFTPLTVMFTDQSTNTPTSWKWEYKTGSGSWTEFGSGARNPSHDFAAGTYDIRLTASNLGGSNNVTRTGYINVNEVPVAPVAGFTANKRSGTPPLTVRFTDLSSGTGPLTYAWDVDNDGSTDSTDQSPLHIYTANGTYTVKLTVMNDIGSNSITKTHFITVSDEQPGQSHAGVAITFDDNSVGDWYAIRSILKNNSANATFFVSNYATLENSDVSMLRTLQADGNEIGYHGYSHLDASTYLENHTISEYMSNEIINGISLMQAGGFDPVDFALPNGHGSDNSNLTNALQQYFIHIRGTSGDSIYYQYGSNTPVIYAQGIDDITYGQSMDDIYNYISTAKENDEIVIFYCHDPVPSDPQDYQISYSRLQNITAFVSQNNMKFYTVSELP